MSETKSCMKAFNIIWDIDIQDIYDALDEMCNWRRASYLEISEEQCADMTTEEIHDYAYEMFRSDESRADFFNLPNEISIPDGRFDEEEVSDYLSEVTGFCHKGFRLCHEHTTLGIK